MITFLKYSNGNTLPPVPLWVCSTHINRVVGRWASPLERILFSMSDKSKVPSGLVCTCRECTPATCATPPCSHIIMCAKSPTSISSPRPGQCAITGRSSKALLIWVAYCYLTTATISKQSLKLINHATSLNKDMMLFEYIILISIDFLWFYSQCLTIHCTFTHLEAHQKHSTAHYIFNSILWVWKCAQTRSFIHVYYLNMGKFRG